MAARETQAKHSLHDDADTQDNTIISSPTKQASKRHSNQNTPSFSATASLARLPTRSRTTLAIGLVAQASASPDLLAARRSKPRLRGKAPTTWPLADADAAAAAAPGWWWWWWL